MWSLLVLSVALGADAFAVALAGSVAGRQTLRAAARVAIAFGLAQALFPVLGIVLASVAGDLFERFGQWIGFGLLTALGVRAVIAAQHPDEGGDSGVLDGWLLIPSAVGVSIDAAVAGGTLGLLGPPVIACCVIIGLVTAAMTLVAASAGHRLARFHSIWTERLAGLALILVGIKLLVT